MARWYRPAPGRLYDRPARIVDSDRSLDTLRAVSQGQDLSSLWSDQRFYSMSTVFDNAEDRYLAERICNLIRHYRNRAQLTEEINLLLDSSY